MTDPIFLTKKDSTKSLIVKILTNYQQLTLAGIQKALRKDAQRKVSYQAIRQATLELVEQGVLLQEEKIFFISKLWVDQLKNLVNNLEKSLEQEHIKKLSQKTTQFKLKNLNELGHFVLYGLANQYFDDKPSQKLHLQLNHLWIPFGESAKRNKLVEIFSQHKMSVSVKNNSLGDKTLAQWYKKHGKVSLNNKNQSGEFIVCGDTLIQIFMHKKLEKLIDKTYSLKNLFKTNLLEHIHEMTNAEHGVDIIITKNSSIAKQMIDSPLQ